MRTIVPASVFPEDAPITKPTMVTIIRRISRISIVMPLKLGADFSSFMGF
jgi:hypothetical protein